MAGVVLVGDQQQEQRCRPRRACFGTDIGTRTRGKVDDHSSDDFEFVSDDDDSGGDGANIILDYNGFDRPH
jgi:hypothetical protein